MKVLLNDGNELELAGNPSLAELIEQMTVPTPCAIVLNGQHIPRIKHAQTPLSDGDQISVISPMQGG